MYRVVTYPEARDQIVALPDEGLANYAETLETLKVEPWSGPPHYHRNPYGAVRYRLFGRDHAGQVIYLILERDREVHMLRVLWID